METLFGKQITCLAGKPVGVIAEALGIDGDEAEDVQAQATLLLARKVAGTAYRALLAAGLDRGEAEDLTELDTIFEWLDIGDLSDVGDLSVEEGVVKLAHDWLADPVWSPDTAGRDWPIEYKDFE
jgi:hypothetical protein